MAEWRNGGMAEWRNGMAEEIVIPSATRDLVFLPE